MQEITGCDGWMIARGAMGNPWIFAEIVNGLMAIPNLIALAILCPEFCRLIKQYQGLFGHKANGGTYEDLDQRKPLRTVSHAEIPSHGGAG